MKRLCDLIERDKNHTEKVIDKSPRKRASPDLIVAFSNIVDVKEESNESITSTSEVGRPEIQTSNITSMSRPQPSVSTTSNPSLPSVFTTNTSEEGCLQTLTSNMTTNPSWLPTSALSLEATVTYLQLEMAKMQRKHQQELMNMTQTMLKVRESMEEDKRKILADFWKQADKEKQMAIEQI